MAASMIITVLVFFLVAVVRGADELSATFVSPKENSVVETNKPFTFTIQQVFPQKDTVPRRRFYDSSGMTRPDIYKIHAELISAESDKSYRRFVLGEEIYAQNSNLTKTIYLPSKATGYYKLLFKSENRDYAMPGLLGRKKEWTSDYTFSVVQCPEGEEKVKDDLWNRENDGLSEVSIMNVNGELIRYIKRGEVILMERV
ncbi:hypothetical protein BKA69DRAFT_1126491 [Paraphysoderma sedebokerense]|nr:hypothetical protein BKA69DRAFT_1126491 [Paraphysoderma sedebokerense]